MAIDDADLFDLAVWVAWKKHMVAFLSDERKIRGRKGVYTALVVALATAIGYKIAGTLGALIMAACAAMYSIEAIWMGSEDEAVVVSEFLLFSEDCSDSHRKYLVDIVRNAILSYESAEFAVLSEMVGAYPALLNKVAQAIKEFLKKFMCFNVLEYPEGRFGDPYEL